MRTEKDFLGQQTFADDIMYGINTLRSIENFNWNDSTTSLLLIRSLILVKKACALSNQQSKLLDKTHSEAIISACDQLLQMDDLLLKKYFVTAPLQGGAGTSTNMNVNEVIANLALLHMGYQKGDYEHLHPIDHVNLSQSTNDVYPTALKIAAIKQVRRLADVLSAFQETLQKKEESFSNILKIGRTQLMDAVPVTLGQEFGAYARCISRDRWRIYKVEERLREINIGATAVGTGMNAPLSYIYGVTDILQNLTGLGLSRSDLLIDTTQNQDVFVEVSGLLKTLASDLIKISNDLRLMSSGPIGGLGEINLPPRQAGSTIMPGKVNPVLCEMINQIAFKVIGSDTSITLAASQGQLELNPYLPLIADELLGSLENLIQGTKRFDQLCVQGITANEDHCKDLALRSPSLAAAFIHQIGYDEASNVAKEALMNHQTIPYTLVQSGRMSQEDVDSILSIHQLTQPGILGHSNS